MSRAKNAKRADGRLQSKVYIGNGKYKYVYADNQRELDKRVSELKIALGKGLDITSERDTFGDWAEQLIEIKKHEVSTHRLKTYEINLRRFEDIKNTPISKLRAIDIQRVIMDMHSENYSAYSIRNVKQTASQVFELAINNRVIDYNPVHGVRLPAEKPPEKRRALTPEEQAWITADSENRGHIAAMVMMYAGLRRGEMIPLMWTDVDLHSRTISVNKAVEIVNGNTVVKPCGKTEAAMRKIKIPQILADFLAEERKKSKSLYVCPAANGNMLSESGYRRMWSSYITDLNMKYGDFSAIIRNGEQYTPKSKFDPKGVPMVIEPITAHMLRHTFITNMYLAGIDIMTAKEQAGHADIQTTMNIYTHLDEEHKTKQIDKLDEFFKSRKIM